MELFSTSRDLVNLALAIGIVAISAAIVYFFISASGFIKELRQTIDEFNRQLEAINEITEAIKSKITYMFSYWSILEKLASKAIDLIQQGVVNKVKSRFGRAAKSARQAVDDFDQSINNDDPVKPKAKTKTKANNKK